MRRKNTVIIVIILIISIPFLLFFLENHMRLTHRSPATLSPIITLPSNGSYITEDSVTAPTVSAAAVEGTITRQTKKLNNHVWQKFIVANSATGSQHIVFEQVEDGIQFEKMTAQNWSPTNRFFYITFDYPDGRRNLLIFETDGRFTDTQYYIEPIQLTQQQTVSQISWSDGETLTFTVNNQQSNTSNKYEVDLNDSAGVLKQLD